MSGNQYIDEINELAALIRHVDGNHNLGAGALAQALVDQGVRVNPPTVEVVRRGSGIGVAIALLIAVICYVGYHEYKYQHCLTNVPMTSWPSECL